MLERKLGDNYTLTVDEMAGVFDMLEESHFPISVTFTFLAEWFESVSCFDTAEKIRNLLDTYLEDENKFLKLTKDLEDALLKDISKEPIGIKEEGENDES